MRIKFNDKVVEVTRHPENSELYCLNDLHKASGGAKSKSISQFKRYQHSDGCEITPLGALGSQRSFADEFTVYQYAAWVSKEFNRAVFEAFKAAANGDGEKAVEIAQAVVDVHEAMLIKKPRHRIRQYFDGKSIEQATECFLKAMSNNPKATYEDRIRTSNSLRAVVNELYDNLHARERDKATQCESSLKLIAEYERYQARLEAAK